jgi:hypothetical protein
MQQKRCGRRSPGWILIGVAVTIAAVASGEQLAVSPVVHANGAASSVSAPVTSDATTALVPGRHRPPTKFHTFGDGTWRVGSQVTPGTYRTRQTGPSCYWARLSGFGGTTGDIIANNFGTGYQAVTISASDAGFQTQGCGTWTSNLSATGAWPRTDGVFIVGTDVSARTYSAPGGSSCYWARLSGFGGTVWDIIANDFGSTHVVVTIAPGDVGFETSNCGTWS